MISGRDALHRIDDAIARARDTLAQTNNAVASGSGNLASVERAEARAFNRLASIRLDLLQSDERQNSLGAADEKAERLIEEHGEATRKLSDQVAAAKTALHKIEADRRRQEEIVDEAISAHETAAAKTHARLENDPAYQARASAIEDANAVAKRAAQKLELARADQAEKGAPYENDPLFSYLWGRKFGSKEYRAFFLSAALDRWVAGLIKYRDARLNYMRLVELPERLEEHADYVDDVAAQLEEDIEAFERDALEHDGVGKLRDKAASAQRTLEQLDAEIEGAERELDALIKAHREMVAGREGPLNEAHKTLVEALAAFSIPDLRVVAAETETDEDDKIVEDLIRLKRERMEIEEARHSLGRALNRDTHVLADMEKLRRRFKSARYDSPYSEFSDGSMITVLLSEILRGSASYNDAWRRLQKIHRTRRRNWAEDFGGETWRDGFGLPPTHRQRGPRKYPPRRRRAPRPLRIPRGPRPPRLPKGGGGFRTGGGF